MNLLTFHSRDKRATTAFTMVEIALSLAVVAFALVAIVGVLPTGLKVQKQNRDETIMIQEGTFLLEAIRSGSLGLDDLTNYFDEIAVSNSISQPQVFKKFTGREIIGLQCG